MGRSNDSEQKLTDLQMRFCNEYAKCLNATLAYKRSGYSLTKSESAIRKEASTLLTNPRIRAYLKEIINLSALNVVSEIAAIAFTNIADVCSWTNNTIELIASDQLSLKTKAAIKSIKTKTRTRTSPEGEIIVENESEVVLHDKLGALEKLMRKLSLYPTETMNAIETLANKGLLLPEQSEVVLNGIRNIDQSLAELPGQQTIEAKPTIDPDRLKEALGINIDAVSTELD